MTDSPPRAIMAVHAGKKGNGEAEAAGRKTPVARQPRDSNDVETALAFFAHEVRTPLTGIVALSDLLAASNISGRERQWVRRDQGGAEHLAAVATVFVDAAKQRHGTLILRRDVFDLGAVVRAAGLSLAGRATARELTFKLDVLPIFHCGCRRCGAACARRWKI